MSKQVDQFPKLEEHVFLSDVPVIGWFIQFIRRMVYNIATKWAVRSLILQQNEINQMMAERLQEYEERLIAQDQDLAHLARIVAETDIRQRYLASKMLLPADSETQENASLDCLSD